MKGHSSTWFWTFFLIALGVGVWAPLELTDNFYFLLPVKNILQHHQWFPVVSDIHLKSVSIMDKPPLFFWWLSAWHFFTGWLPLEIKTRLPNIVTSLILVFGLARYLKPKPYTWLTLFIFVTGGQFLTFSKNTFPDLLNLAWVISANLAGYHLLQNQFSLKKFSLFWSVILLGIFTKGGTIFAFSLAPLFVYAALLWFQSKGRHQASLLFLSLSLGILSLLAFSYLGLKIFWPQHALTQTLIFCFEAGRVNAAYLQFHFQLDKLYYLIQVFFPYSLLIPAFIDYFKNQKEPYDHFIKVWLLVSLLIGFFLIQRTDSSAYFTALFPLAYILGKTLWGYAQQSSVAWKKTGWFHLFFLGALFLAALSSPEVHALVLKFPLLLIVLGSLFSYLGATFCFLNFKKNKALPAMLIAIGIFIATYFAVYPQYLAWQDPSQKLMNRLIQLDRQKKLKDFQQLIYVTPKIYRDRYGQIFSHDYFALKYLWGDRLDIVYTTELRTQPSKKVLVIQNHQILNSFWSSLRYKNHLLGLRAPDPAPFLCLYKEMGERNTSKGYPLRNPQTARVAITALGGFGYWP